MKIEDRVEQAIDQTFNRSHPLLIVGVSGGVDSMTLLYALHSLDVRALVVHVNYEKRGAESDKDAELVEQMAFEWGFDCHSIRAGDRFDSSDQGNFQQWARDFRYRAFRALREEYEAEGIAVAHNEDDQIETILQKIFRGGGLESWSAMEVWDGELFRPLIEVPRSEIEKYAVENAIPYRTDRSNLQTGFARNYLRNEWLDGLEEHFPGWRKNVLRIPGQADLFGKALEELDKNIFVSEKLFLRQEYLELDQGLRKALLIHHLRKLDMHWALSHDALATLDKMDELQTGKSIRLSSGLEIMRDRDHFELLTTIREGGNGEGSDRVGDAPPDIQIKKEDLQSDELLVNGYVFDLVPYGDIDKGPALQLDADKLNWPLRLRAWEEGDRFRPLGMEGHQKVADHLTNRKISAARKAEAMVLETFDGNICAVIFPPDKKGAGTGTISEIFKCGASTQECLKVKQG
ncbi:MAG: tRNA lysidine(34) synthetase TilS [Balneolaceae bacterium]|nr:tRNA lysidine(34) synthetase TilS [Balneolaceae bacterium]